MIQRSESAPGERKGVVELLLLLLLLQQQQTRARSFRFVFHFDSFPPAAARSPRAIFFPRESGGTFRERSPRRGDARPDSFFSSSFFPSGEFSFSLFSLREKSGGETIAREARQTRLALRGSRCAATARRQQPPPQDRYTYGTSKYGDVTYAERGNNVQRFIRLQLNALQA